MKIAAAYDNGTVCQDFAQTKQFKLYTIEDDHISQMEIVDAAGDPAQCLKQHGAGLLVCGKLDSQKTAAFVTAQGRVPYQDVSGHDFTALLLGNDSSKTYEYVMVPNTGDTADYQGLDVTGKIAVVIGLAVVAAIGCLNTFRKKA